MSAYNIYMVNSGKSIHTKYRCQVFLYKKPVLIIIEGPVTMRLIHYWQLCRLIHYWQLCTTSFQWSFHLYIYRKEIHWRLFLQWFQIPPIWN